MTAIVRGGVLPRRPRPGAGARTADPPAGTRRQVAHYLGQARAVESQLRDALALVAERHQRNFEIARGTTTLALWSAEHLDWLAPLIDRYGALPSERPEQLRSAILNGTRTGVVGELADLSDLAVLAASAEMAWTILEQGAREIHDEELVAVASEARAHTSRQLAWLRGQVRHEAPDAVAIPLEPMGQLAVSIPTRAPGLAALPDSVWGPLAASALILLVGLAGLLFGGPWLMASLGPSAVLFAVTPAHPSARAWNTFVGHLVGLGAGILVVALLSATDAPTVFGDGQLVPVRVAAAVLAVGLTLLVGSLARAQHPPAAATTLLVALGAIATADQALSLLAGVGLLTIAGELLRRWRLQRLTPAERMAPRGGQVGALLRR